MFNIQRQGASRGSKNKRPTRQRQFQFQQLENRELMASNIFNFTYAAQAASYEANYAKDALVAQSTSASQSEQKANSAAASTPAAGALQSRIVSTVNAGKLANLKDRIASDLLNSLTEEVKSRQLQEVVGNAQLNQRGIAAKLGAASDAEQFADVVAGVASNTPGLMGTLIGTVYSGSKFIQDPNVLDGADAVVSLAGAIPDPRVKAFSTAYSNTRTFDALTGGYLGSVFGDGLANSLEYQGEFGDGQPSAEASEASYAPGDDNPALDADGPDHGEPASSGDSQSESDSEEDQSQPSESDDDSQNDQSEDQSQSSDIDNDQNTDDTGNSGGNGSDGTPVPDRIGRGGPPLAFVTGGNVGKQEVETAKKGIEQARGGGVIDPIEDQAIASLDFLTSEAGIDQVTLETVAIENARGGGHTDPINEDEVVEVINQVEANQVELILAGGGRIDPVDAGKPSGSAGGLIGGGSVANRAGSIASAKASAKADADTCQDNEKDNAQKSTGANFTSSYRSSISQSTSLRSRMPRLSFGSFRFRR